MNLELMHTSSHRSKNVSEEHLLTFYKSFDELKDRKFDGMIITGAPVEKLEFEEVDYWEELKEIMRPLYEKHMDDIESGVFSSTMMADWEAGDKDLLRWRKETGESAFENAPACDVEIKEQEFFDKGIFSSICSACSTSQSRSSFISSTV